MVTGHCHCALEIVAKQLQNTKSRIQQWADAQKTKSNNILVNCKKHHISYFSSLLLLQSKRRVCRRHLVLLLLVAFVDQGTYSLAFIPPFATGGSLIFCLFFLVLHHSLVSFGAESKKTVFYSQYCQACLQLSCCFCLLFHFLPLSSWHWPFFSGMLVEILDSHHIHFSMWPLHIHASGSTQEEGWGRKIRHPMKDSPGLHRSGRPFLLEHLALVRREEGKESPWWLLVTGNRAFYKPPPKNTHHIGGQTTTTVVQGGDYFVQGTTTKTRPHCTRPLPAKSNNRHPPGLSVPAQTKRDEDLFFCRGNPANHHNHGTKRQLTMGEKQLGPKQAIDPRIIFGPIVCILINRK